MRRVMRGMLMGIVAAACVAGGIYLASSASGASEGAGSIASKHPLDAGIAGDKDVIFADDFENWGADGKGSGRWSYVYSNAESLTSAVPGKIGVDGRDGPGSRVLLIQCWANGGNSSTGGVSLKLGNYDEKDRALGPGFDEIYIRYYMMFDPTYRPMANHGQNVGGRDLSRPGARFVGMADTRDVASQRYFFSGLQPSDKESDFHLFFYSYHMDKPDQWGDIYPIQKKTPIALGRWYCVERHMKLNTVAPLKADGVEELWIDGELSIRREGLRFRNIPTLRISLFNLETYYHHPTAEWTRAHPIKVFFDHVVVAKSYIGPMAIKGKSSSSGSGGKFSLPPGYDPSDPK